MTMEQSILKNLIYRLEYGDPIYEIQHYKVHGNVIKMTLLVKTEYANTNDGDNAKTSEGAEHESN